MQAAVTVMTWMLNDVRDDTNEMVDMMPTSLLQKAAALGILTRWLLWRIIVLEGRSPYPWRASPDFSAGQPRFAGYVEMKDS